MKNTESNLKEVIVTRFYYKFGEMFTMFSDSKGVIAIECEGYEVTNHQINPWTAILDSITPIEVEDVDAMIETHFLVNNA